MIVAVDFDGTLVEHVYPGIGAPKIPVIERCKALKRFGHKLILWTCRDGEALEQAVAAMKLHGLEFDAINENIPDENWPFPTSKKVYADYYVDDKAVNVENFA